MFGSREVFKNDLEASGVISPKYEPVASHGDPINARNVLPEASFFEHILKNHPYFYK